MYIRTHNIIFGDNPGRTFSPDPTHDRAPTLYCQANVRPSNECHGRHWRWMYRVVGICDLAWDRPTIPTGEIVHEIAPPILHRGFRWCYIFFSCSNAYIVEKLTISSIFSSTQRAIIIKCSFQTIFVQFCILLSKHFGNSPKWTESNWICQT